MIQNRVIWLYIILSCLSISVYYRVYSISQNKNLAAVSDRQSSYVLEVSNQRGAIYDCNFKPIVNVKDKYIAAIIPNSETITAIMKYIDQEDKDDVITKIREGKPFLTKVNDYNIYNDGIEIINIKERYQDNQLSPHIIGYINGDGDGVCGLEKAYDQFFKDNMSKIKIKYQMNAWNKNYEQSLPTIECDDKYNKRGLVLTIDKRIQEIVEKSSKDILKGSIVVMDAQNGDIKGIASIPKYEPNNITKYLNDPNSPMLNRSFCSYNVGSTYKLIVASAALEEDYDKFINFKDMCTGYKQISSNIFKCHFSPGHGTIDMKRALEISCNPYFIDLALETGPMNILNLSKKIGFGTSDILSKDMVTNKGSLPNKSTLITKSDIANLGFGQGELTATPIQIAKVVSTISNDGYLVSPRLIKGISDKEGKYIETEEKYHSQARVISKKTAQTLKDMMISVVENGSGKNAKPNNGGAGGKTASAQTGRYIDEREIVHAWFSGFFPTLSPKYVIVILVEDGESGSNIAAPIFKKIADNINSLT